MTSTELYDLTPTEDLMKVFMDDPKYQIVVINLNTHRERDRKRYSIKGYHFAVQGIIFTILMHLVTNRPVFPVDRHLEEAHALLRRSDSGIIILVEAQPAGSTENAKILTMGNGSREIIEGMLLDTIHYISDSIRGHEADE